MSRAGNISFSGLASGMDTDSIIKDMMKVQRMKVDRFKKKNTSITYKQDEWKKLNAKIYSFYSKDLGKFRLNSNYNNNKVISSNEAVATIDNKDQNIDGTHELEILQLASNAQDRSQKLVKTDGSAVDAKTKLTEMGLQIDDALQVEYEVAGETKSITVKVSENDTLIQLADKLKQESKGKLDLNVNMDYVNGRMFISTKKTGAEIGFQFSGKVAEKFGLSSTMIKGKNAQFRYNGGSDVFESASNELEVNGIKATAKSVGKTTFSIEKDREGAYKKVVEFVKQYNALAKELQDKINVSIPRSQRGIEPLTDEEKKALSDDEVKKWEETLRGQVFKRDKNLRSLLGDMRSTLIFSESSKTKEYKTLGSIGIGTGKFREGTGAMLFIDGDSEVGGSRSTEPNKLKAALEKNPEEVGELLSELGQKLYDKMTARMKSTSLRSYMSFYDDKALQQEYKSYEKKIELMEDKMYAIEERYRKQFAAMEKAIQQSNSTSSWLSQQLGGLR